MEFRFRRRSQIERRRGRPWSTTRGTGGRRLCLGGTRASRIQNVAQASSAIVAGVAAAIFAKVRRLLQHGRVVVIHGCKGFLSVSQQSLLSLAAMQTSRSTHR
jgi:hypothetical protein